MKHYIPFLSIILLGLGIFLWQFFHQDVCLFDFQGRCYTCNEDKIFFVGLAENCNICPNRQAKYIDWNNKSIWACLNVPVSENEEISFQESVFNVCSKHKPLQDILGHCYTCNVAGAIQISNGSENVCLGKRYITYFRNSKKSTPCPSINKIKDPYVCTACRGHWQNERCHSFSITETQFCQKNSDCPENFWCFPFLYPVYSKTGVCRPYFQQKFIYSETDGYTWETAQNYCFRQNGHIPTFEELELEKENILSLYPETNAWIIFEDGSIYLDSLKRPFVITKEKESLESGGDNTHAFCILN